MQITQGNVLNPDLKILSRYVRRQFVSQLALVTLTSLLSVASRRAAFRVNLLTVPLLPSTCSVQQGRPSVGSLGCDLYKFTK